MVSKVAMSVCALLVAGGLAEAVGTALPGDAGGDLEDLLAAIQRDVSSLSSSGGDCELRWTVPALPSGREAHVCFRGGHVEASAGGSERAADTAPEIHAWAWDGKPLNETAVRELDMSCRGLDAVTGDTVTLSAATVLLDDSPELLVFVR